VAWEVFPEEVHRNHDAEKTEESKYKKDFAAGNSRCAWIAGAARRHPFIQFNRAPKNQNERPPVPDHFANADAPVVVKEQQQSYEEQEKSGKKRAAASTKIRHEALLSLTGNLILGSSWQGARRIRSRRRNPSRNVAFRRRGRRAKTDDSQDDENDRIGSAEGKITAAQLIEKKKHSNRYDRSGTH
jgi:hypothetical protein